MGIDKSQLTMMIASVLKQQELYSENALAMLLATSAHESEFGTYMFQIGGGPARGLFGMEQATERSIWHNYLRYKRERKRAVVAITGVMSPHPYNNDALLYNMAYQICLARLYYLTAEEALPKADNPKEQMRYWATYWKRVNVTENDREDFMKDYERFIG